MKTHSILFVLATAMLLSACQAVRQDSRPYRIREGSVLQLNVPLRFAPGRVAVYLHKGRVVPVDLSHIGRYFRDYKPFCILELKKKPSRPVTVRPGRFKIYAVKYQNWAAALFKAQQHGITLVKYGSTVPFEFETELFLSSKKQPEVYKLSCSHRVDPLLASYVEVREIRSALGKVMTLYLRK